jgi:Resolvase, N terminal domain/Recombinase
MARNFQPAEDKSKQPHLWGHVPKLPIEYDCVIYPRISTPGQRGNVSSELQLKEDGELWNLALRLGWKQHQVRHPKEDMELSGTLRMEDRPAFKQMLQWIINREVRAVIAVNVDRLFRDKWGTEYSKFMEICEKYNVLVITPDMIYDFSDNWSIKSFRDKCIQAWEYLDYQVYKRMLGAKDYLGETGRWAGGNLPPGYIVDRNKQSPTFRKYIRYIPWCPTILEMFERYRELNDNLMALHREYDAKPFMFPDFEEWVDPEIVAKCKLKKVPEGYTMSLSTMVRLLTNPVYIGWWIYDNKILVDEKGMPVINHEPIIPPERQQELFWHVFKQRSPFNIDGTKNEDTIGQKPRRYSQVDSPPNPALLKLIVTSGDPQFVIRVQPQYNRKNLRTGKYLYSFRKRMNGYTGGAKYMLATDMVDSVYWQRLFEHLWQTHDFDDYAKTEEAAEVNKEKEVQEVTEQIAACDRKIAKLLKRLAIVQEGKEDAENETIIVDTEEQKARDKALKKMIAFLTDEIAKYTAEKTRLESRRDKLTGKKPDTYAAQMIEYHELLRELGERAREIYTVEELYDVVDTFTTGVVLDTLSPRVWKLTITWRDPVWGTDEIVCVRTEGNPSITWTEDERTILHEYYETASRRKLLTLLPNRSWVAIRTLASELKLRRHRDDSSIQFPYDICLNDWNAIQEYNLPIFIGDNGLMAYKQEQSAFSCLSMGIGKLTRSWR